MERKREMHIECVGRKSMAGCKSLTVCLTFRYCSNQINVLEFHILAMNSILARAFQRGSRKLL